MSAEELSWSLVKSYRSSNLTIFSYIVAIAIPLLSVLLWFLIDKNHIPNKIPKNYTVSDFLLPGLVLGYFFFFILATTDIIRKRLKKIELDALISKIKTNEDFLHETKKIYYINGIFSLIALVIISIGFASNKLGILVFKRYVRKTAPPGVGPGIAEAHTLNFQA